MRKLRQHFRVFGYNKVRLLAAAQVASERYKGLQIGDFRRCRLNDSDVNNAAPAPPATPRPRIGRRARRVASAE